MERAARLEVMHALQHKRLATETPEERDARLEGMRAIQQRRLATETPEERDARLEGMRCYIQQRRLATETPEERDARLEGIRAIQQRRLATETPEERDARLEGMRAIQQRRLATETPKERATRLEHLQQNRNGRQKTHLPLLEQSCVRDKMLKFHQEISMIQISACSTCMEKFPGMKLTSQSECLRCSRDKLSPKLYSTANNMTPGPVPPELQVQVIKFTVKNFICVCM